MAWVLLKKPDGKRLLQNLALTFAFDEQPDGTASAISINGAGVPTGSSMDSIVQDQMEDGGWVVMRKPDGLRLLLNLELTFSFEENEAGMGHAVSLNGISAPSGMTMDAVMTSMMKEED